jgi:abhydrolase domain-containing protein 6
MCMIWLTSVTAAAAIVATYFLFPLRWAAPLVRIERARAGVRARRVLVQGRSFAYWDGGTGTALVMIHGFGADKDHWTAAARRLRRRFRVVAMDLPGFGETPAQQGERFDVRSQAAQVRAFIEALNIRRFHVVGSSMGGHIAGVLAHDFPEGVLSLTLVECHGVHSREPSLVDRELAQGKSPLLPATPREFMRLLDLLFVKRPFLPNAVIQALCTQALATRPLRLRIWADLWGPDAFLLESLRPQPALPTLVVWGDSDRFFHRSAVETLQRGLPHAEVVMMDRCGHEPMFERPAEFALHPHALRGERVAMSPSASGGGGSRVHAPYLLSAPIRAHVVSRTNISVLDTCTANVYMTVCSLTALHITIRSRQAATGFLIHSKPSNKSLQS